MQKSTTALNESILSDFDRIFRISWKPFSLWSLKNAVTKTMPFDRPYFRKMMWSHQNMTFVNAQSNFFLKTCVQNFMKPKRFFLQFHKKSLTFFFAVTTIAYFRFKIVQVSRFDGWKLLPIIFLQ